MSNALYQPYVAGTQAEAVAPLYDPRPENQARVRFRREPVEQLKLANSFVVSNGLTPSRGWVLLRRADYEQLNPFATNLQLLLNGFVAGAPEVVLRGLSVVQARCVSTGVKGDPDAVYLVELCDGLGVLWNPWFSFPTTSEYNVRAPAYPQPLTDDPGGFYLTSLENPSTPWTWEAMAGDLWGQMSSVLGTFPGLPLSLTLTEDVENFSYPGGSCWEALDHVLSHLGCTTSTDLTSATAPYGVVEYGAADLAFDALTAAYARFLEDDLEYIDGGAGRVPGQVVVYFHRRNEYYGTEETVRRDALQWTMTPFYSTTVSAAAAGFPQFAGAPGTGYLWCEFSVRFDVDGNPLPSDVTTAAALAAERAGNYYTRTFRGTLGFMQRTYACPLPFATGSQVDGVRWHMTFKDGRLGWRTTLVRGPEPPFPELSWERR